MADAAALLPEPARATVLLTLADGRPQPAGARAARGTFAPVCLDWSERRYHLAGALGAALRRRLFDAGWVERTAEPRVARLTPA